MPLVRSAQRRRHGRRLRRHAERRAGANHRQQRRRARRRGNARHARRAMAQGDRRVAQRILPRHPAPAAANAAHALGPNLQHLVRRRADRQLRPGQLRRRQGRAQQRDQGAVAGGCIKGRHGERDCAGNHCVADGGCGV